MKGYEQGYVLVEVRNHFSIRDCLEVLEPSRAYRRFEVESLIDSLDGEVDRVYKPMEIVRVKCEQPIVNEAFLRRVRG